jgi:predicted DNA-binding protein with PD1-like motif
MKYSQAQTGRTFVIRLEDGDILHETIEKFCLDKNIQSGYLQVVGGIDKGSILIVGPEDGRAENIVPMKQLIDDPCEATGTGTVFPDETGTPVLHMHLACGRKKSTITGCVRKGVIVWHVLEIVLIELTNNNAKRLLEKNTGFKLLNP